MPKQDCKYWDKCYQRNEQHLQKYNHPDKEDETKKRHHADSTGSGSTATAATSPTTKTSPPKCKTSAADAGKESGSTMAAADTQRENAKALSPAKGRQEIDTTELRAEALNNIAGKNYMEILNKRIKLSVQAEYDELLRSNEFIRHKFLVEMPPDFYAFWKFVCELKPDTSGEQALQYLEKQFQLQLVGPFEFLAGRFHKATIREPGDYLRHWRFFYDPPEFQTILVRRGTGIHYGYWRDTPQDKEHLLIARNAAAKDCVFEFIAGNVFDAFLYFIEHDFTGTPFTAAAVASTRKALHKFMETNEIRVEKLEVLHKRRSAKVVAKTFHRAGIVVPFVAATQLGYRPLIVSEAELKKITQLFATAGAKDDDKESSERIKEVVIEKLQPIATAASIAIDECDFGTALELGIDLFCCGRTELHMLAQSLLVPAYSLLSRPQFIAISKAHMEHRSKTFNLSIFELGKK